jgi:RNA 2',3'-cyclic 3'-phosphodiesterase
MARMFAAVRLPESSLRSLAEAQYALERRIIDVKWVEEENLHFTLRFFGELTPDELARAIEAATTVTEMTPAFTIEITGLGAFPEHGRPRVLWAGVEAGREPLVRLAQALDRAFAAAGLGAADRPFAPHLTLGRVRDPNPRRGRGPRPPQVPPQAAAAVREAIAQTPCERVTVSVAAVALVESRLSSRGPTYVDRQRLALKS